MLGLFRKKLPAEKLQKKYQKIMEEAYKLSTVNRKLSDAKYAKAEEVSEPRVVT
ncbi:MAG: Lacal_2735 family protein [Bacteroidota bacterium]